MTRWRLFWIIGFCLLLTVSLVTAQNDCGVLVEAAITQASETCAQIGRNQLCYGNTNLEVTAASGADIKMDTPGDLADLINVSAVHASPLNAQNDEWGIGIMSVQANLPDTLPGQNVTFLLVGDVTVENLSPEDTPPMQFFRYSTGIGRSGCEEAPYNTLVLQNPHGTEVILTANGIEIGLGSTAVLFAQANDQARLLIVEGQGSVRANSSRQIVPEGRMTTVKLGGDDGFTPISAPAPAFPYPTELLQGIPFDLLPDPVTLPETISATTDMQAVTITTTVPSALGVGEDGRINIALTGDAAECPVRSRQPLDVVLVIDISGSMEGAPLASAKSSALAFINQLDPAVDRVGVVAFESTARLVSPLGTDFSTANGGIAGLASTGGTAIDTGLNLGYTTLQASDRTSEALPVIILLSDGASDAAAANAAADQIKAANIQLNTIGVGASDQSLLSQLASSPQDYAYSGSFANLRNIFVNSALSLTGSVAAQNIRVTYALNTEAYDLVADSYQRGTFLDSGQVAWSLPVLYDGQTINFDFLLEATQVGAAQAIGTLAVTYTPCDEPAVASITPDVPTIAVQDSPIAGETRQPGELLTLDTRTSGELDSFEIDSWMLDVPTNELFSLIIVGAGNTFAPEIIGINETSIRPLYTTGIAGTDTSTSVYNTVVPGPYRLFVQSGGEADTGSFDVQIVAGAADVPFATLSVGDEVEDTQQGEGKTYNLQNVEDGQTITLRIIQPYNAAFNVTTGLFAEDGSISRQSYNGTVYDYERDQRTRVFILTAAGDGDHRLFINASSEYTLLVEDGDTLREDVGIITVGETLEGRATQDDAYYKATLNVDEPQMLTFVTMSDGYPNLSISHENPRGLRYIKYAYGENFEADVYEVLEPGAVTVSFDSSNSGTPYTLAVLPGDVLSNDMGVIAPGDEVTNNAPPGLATYTLEDAAEGDTITVAYTVSNYYASRPITITSADDQLASPLFTIEENDSNYEGGTQTQVFSLAGEPPYHIAFPVAGEHTFTVRAGDQTRFQAGSLVFGTQERGTVQSGRVDLWTFEGIQGAGVELELDGNYDAEMALLDPNGTKIASDYNLITNFTLPVDGTYTVAISPTRSRSTNYTLRVDSIEIAQPFFGTLVSGEPQTRTLVPDLTDNWSFEATAGQRVHLTIEMDNVYGAVTLISPSGNMIGEVSGGYEDLQLSGITLTDTGIYNVTVESYNNQRDDYTITLILREPFDPSKGVELEIVANGAVNLRSGPGTNYNIVTTAAPGTLVIATARNTANDWYKVVTEDDTEAWVFNSLIRPTDDEADLSALPVE